MDFNKKMIAYCRKDKACLAQCIDKLEPDYFEGEYRLIFKLLQGYYSKYRSCFSDSVFRKLLDSSALEIDGNVSFEIEGLFEEASHASVNPTDCAFDIEQFIEKYSLRLFTETIEGSGEKQGLLEIASKDSLKAYREFNKTLGPVMESQNTQGRVQRSTVADGMEGVLEEYEIIAHDKSKAFGIKTGFSFIDKITLGMKPGEMFCVGGRPGQGKSIFLLNMAVNAFKAGHSVIIISLEMPLKQYMQRFISCYAHLPATSIETGELTSEEKRSMKEAMQEIIAKQKDEGVVLDIIDIPGGTSLTVESELNRIETEIDGHKRFPPDLIVVDYLGIMSSIENLGQKADWQEQGKVAEELRGVGRRKDLPVATATQLNRDKKKGKGTERIARSDIIAATVDVFLQIEEPDDENDELALDDTMSIYIGKNRKGMTDKSYKLFRDFSRMSVLDRGDQVEKRDAFEEIESSIALDTEVDEDAPEMPL